MARAMDAVNKRYGDFTVTFASLMDTEEKGSHVISPAWRPDGIRCVDVKFRIRSDRSIECAEKWHPEVDAGANELRFEIFQEPVIRIWKEIIDIADILHRLADKNIPFIVEKHIQSTTTRKLIEQKHRESDAKYRAASTMTRLLCDNVPEWLGHTGCSEKAFTQYPGDPFQRF